MTFKVLHCLLVFLRRSFCLEGAEISSLTRLRIFLAGIQPVLAGFQLPDHRDFSAVRGSPMQTLLSHICPLDAARSIQYSQTEWIPRSPYEMNLSGLLMGSFSIRTLKKSASSPARIPRLVAK